MEFTQEQLNKMVAEAVAGATKGLYTEEELAKRVTAEVDRRVESGIQKGLETQKSKWEQEFSEKAKLSAEELAKRELDKQLTAISEKEKVIAKRSNLIEAKEFLNEAGIPKTYYEKFTEILISDDTEVTKTNVQNFVDMFSKTKQELETQIKSEFTNVKPPSTGGKQTLTKQDFDGLGYADKIKFKTDNPELYKKFME